MVRAKYLKNKDKLATQVGTQRPANPNFDRVRELIKDGAVGELQHVHVWGNRQLFPRDGDAGLTHYKPRPQQEQIPPMGGFQEQWVNACKGDLKTSCDFDYGGTLIEQMLLGLVAYRVGKKIDYDGDAGRVTNDTAANDLLSREYRKGWKLDA